MPFCAFFCLFLPFLVSYSCRTESAKIADLRELTFLDFFKMSYRCRTNSTGKTFYFAVLTELKLLHRHLFGGII